MHIDTVEGIRDYLEYGIDGLYALERDRSKVDPLSLKTWILKDVGVYLSGAQGGWGGMSKLCSVEGEIPNADIFEFSKETCEGLMVSTSPLRMPKSGDECAICGNKWSLSTFADARPLRDGGVVHESCRSVEIQQAQIDALKSAGCAVTVEEGKVVGRAHGWVFCKGSNPSYWRATTTKPLSQDAATRLHNLPFLGRGGYYSGGTGILGDVVRFRGHCGCPEPDGPADSYHIDSDEALAAFVAGVIT